MLPVYIDIDGTLTDKTGRGGNVIKSRVETIRMMIDSGVDVVIWSAAGTEYAREFAASNKINAVAAIGKPEYCIDDTESIKWDGLNVRSPGFIDLIEPIEKALKLNRAF